MIYFNKNRTNAGLANGFNFGCGYMKKKKQKKGNKFHTEL